MSTRKAINRVAAGGLKYKPIYTPPPPPPPPKQRPKLGPILIGGTLLYVTATYVSMLVFKSKNDTNDIVAGKTEKPSVTPATFDTANVWESVAKKYDQEIGWDEVVMGVGLLRRWLIGKAKVSPVGAMVRVNQGERELKDVMCREMCWKYPQAQAATLTTTTQIKSILSHSQIDTSQC